MIPKKIHYCWLSGNPFPADIQNYISGWKKKLPDYEFILWDKERFDLDSSKWCKQAYEAKKYAFAADYIRLFAIFNEGGIYLDCDIEVLKSFNELLELEIILALEQSDTDLIEAGCFGAIAGHAFIGDCLSYYIGRDFIKENGSVDDTILPFIMSKIAKEKYSINDLTTLPPTTLTSKSAKDGIIRYDDTHFAIHHFNSHWMENDLWLARKIEWDIYSRLGKNLFSKSIGKVLFMYSISRRIQIRVKRDGFKNTISYYKKYIK